MTISSLSKTMPWIMLAAVSVLVPAVFAASSSTDKTSMEQVQQQLKEAAAVIKNYSVEQRDEAGREVKATLIELDADIERLQQRLDKKADHMDQAVRQKARETLAGPHSKISENNATICLNVMEVCSRATARHGRKSSLVS